MNFIGQGFQKLEHYRHRDRHTDTKTDTQTDETENLYHAAFAGDILIT